MSSTVSGIQSASEPALLELQRLERGARIEDWDWSFQPFVSLVMHSQRLDLLWANPGRGSTL